MRFKCVCLVWILATVFTSSVHSAEVKPVKIIHAGTLLAIPGQQPTSQQSIIVEEDRIREIRDGYITASDVGGNAEVIDLSSNFVMPGFIDCHVHLHVDGVKVGKLTDPFYAEFNTMTDAEYALRSVRPAMRTLRQGFTTLRNAGAHSTFAIRDLRDAINAGYIDGPRILSPVSFIQVPGGIDDMSVHLRDELKPLRTPPGNCSNAGDCRKAVREMFKLGADFIKVEGESAANRDGNGLGANGPHFTDEEMFAIVDTAHRLGLKAAVHAKGNSIPQAIRAGADSIEHGWGLNEKIIREFKKSNAYLVPTLSGVKQYVKDARDPDSGRLSKWRAQKLAQWDAVKKGTAMAVKAGIKFAFGTDSSIVPHGENLKEFLYLQEVGMSPMEAIKSATVHAADLLDLNEEIGTIEAGKSADIIAVANNPLKKMEHLLDMRFVMARGTVFRHD